MNNNIGDILFSLLSTIARFPFILFLVALGVYGGMRRIETSRMQSNRIISLSWLTAMLTTITSLSYTTQKEATTGLFGFFSYATSVQRGWPFVWSGLTGLSVVSVPIALVLNLGVWFAVALCIITPAYYAGCVGRRPFSQRTLLSGAVLLVMLIPCVAALLR